MMDNIVELPIGDERLAREVMNGLRPIILASLLAAEADTIIADLEPRVLRIIKNCPKWELPQNAAITTDQLQGFISENFMWAVTELLQAVIELHMAKKG